MPEDDRRFLTPRMFRAIERLFEPGVEWRGDTDLLHPPARQTRTEALVMMQAAANARLGEAELSALWQRLRDPDPLLDGMGMTPPERTVDGVAGMAAELGGVDQGVNAHQGAHPAYDRPQERKASWDEWLEKTSVLLEERKREKR